MAGRQGVGSTQAAGRHEQDTTAEFPPINKCHTQRLTGQVALVTIRAVLLQHQVLSGQSALCLCVSYYWRHIEFFHNRFTSITVNSRSYSPLKVVHNQLYVYFKL